MKNLTIRPHVGATDFSYRKRLLYFGGDARVSPWAEMGILPPDGCAFEGWPLGGANEWRLTSESETIAMILVDVDVIAKTVPLDEWALKAWRSTFNDLLARALSPEGKSTLLMAYTREPSWETALIALRIGARDLTKLSRLNERISEHLLPKSTSAAEADGEETTPGHENLPDNVISLTKKQRQREPETPQLPYIEAAMPLIPKHAIPFPIDGLEGHSSAIEGVRNLVRKTAPLETSILITGATGSGKERVARAIHRHSSRSNGPFVAVNCGAIAPGLIESELFGHLKGAFTGAVEDRTGLLAAADGGTLLIDEVSELSLEFQVKLLRVLQERKITPVGSSKSQPIDVRVITVTKQDLDDLVRQKRFREDLLYRLRVIEISLPSLRERRADIPGISKTVLRRLAKQSRHSVLQLSESAVEKFLLHTWPGNIRELENALDHAATLTWADGRDVIEVKDLPETVQFATMSLGKGQELKDAVRNFEKEYIAATVRRLGSKEQAAEALGLSLATLYRKLGS